MRKIFRVSLCLLLISPVFGLTSPDPALAVLRCSRENGQTGNRRKTVPTVILALRSSRNLLG